MKKRIGILLAMLVLAIGALTAPPVPVVHAFECSDEVMNACQDMWTTAMNQCMAGGNDFNICWNFANKRHSDCLRVNNCKNT